MKRVTLLIALVLAGILLAGAGGCSSDPNVEGAKLDLRNKDYDRALENVNTALDRDPQNAEALELKGRILQEKAQEVQDVTEHTRLVMEMTETFRKAAQVDPEMTDLVQQRLRLAYYNEFQRGIQAFNQGKDDKNAFNNAAQYFQNAADIQPDSSGAHVNRAFALINAGRQSDAIGAFENALKAGDTAPENYLFLGELYVTTDRAPEAVTLLETARKAHPDNADVQAQLLNAYMVANQMDRAMQVYREAVERDPSNKLYRYNYGSLLLEAEDYDEAIVQLKAAIELDGSYANAQYNLGAAYINKAVELSARINDLDDELREQRSTLSNAQITQKENEIEKLSDERRALFALAVPALEVARDQMVETGEDAMAVCQALFQSYVQTGQQEKAQATAECAGYDDIN